MHEMFSRSKRRAEAGSSPVGLEEHGGGFWGCPEPLFPPAQALRGHPSPEPGGHEAVTEGGSRGCLLRGCGNSE